MKNTSCTIWKNVIQKGTFFVEIASIPGMSFWTLELFLICKVRVMLLILQTIELGWLAIFQVANLRTNDNMPKEKKVCKCVLKFLEFATYKENFGKTKKSYFHLNTKFCEINLQFTLFERFKLNWVNSSFEKLRENRASKVYKNSKHGNFIYLTLVKYFVKSICYQINRTFFFNVKKSRIYYHRKRPKKYFVKQTL